MKRFIMVVALMLLSSLSVLRAASAPVGMVSYKVYLAASPDPDLLGKKVDVVSRVMTNNSAVSLEKIVLQNVLVLSIQDNEWADSPRAATLALSPQEAKKLDKISNQVGVDILVRSR
jgi:hypothetical protein